MKLADIWLDQANFCATVGILKLECDGSTIGGDSLPPWEIDKSVLPTNSPELISSELDRDVGDAAIITTEI